MPSRINSTKKKQKVTKNENDDSKNYEKYLEKIKKDRNDSKKCNDKLLKNKFVGNRMIKDLFNNFTKYKDAINNNSTIILPRTDMLCNSKNDTYGYVSTSD